MPYQLYCKLGYATKIIVHNLYSEHANMRLGHRISQWSIPGACLPYACFIL